MSDEKELRTDEQELGSDKQKSLSDEQELGFDEQELWFTELEKENSEHMALLEESQRNEATRDAINTQQLKKKTDAAKRLKAKHPVLSFMQRYNVIIILVLLLIITLAFNIFMFIN